MLAVLLYHLTRDDISVCFFLFLFFWDTLVFIAFAADSGTTTQPKQLDFAKFSELENHFGLE